MYYIMIEKKNIIIVNTTLFLFKMITTYFLEKSI